MSTPVKPKIGDWYKSTTGDTFEVVAINEHDQTIDIQHFEGEVEEHDFDTWNEMGLININPPEDWSGPYDDLVADDLGDIEQAKHPENWGSFLDELDRGE